MAGPLIACPACSEYVLTRDASCPYCGAAVHGGGATVRGRTAGAVLMGLALAGCPAEDDSSDPVASTTTDDPTNVTTSALYGGPVTGDFSSSTTGSTGGGTATGTGSDTDEDTDTDTETGGTTGGGSTSISPDYGVPSTTTGE